MATIPFEVVSLFTIPRSQVDWEVAQEAQFPFAERTKRTAASLIPRPKNARVRVCPESPQAERAWWVMHKVEQPMPPFFPAFVGPAPCQS